MNLPSLTKAELAIIRERVQIAEGVAVALLFAVAVVVLAIYATPVPA